MKLITTLGLAIVLSCTALAGLSYSGTVGLPYQTKDELKAKCKAAGGDFTSAGSDYSCWGKKGAVLCNKKSKNCYGDCAACGTKAMTKTLPNIIIGTIAKKRPKVLQEGGGGGGQGGNVNPTVIGSNPGAPPVGGGGLED
jgi:hypothetical protein